MLTAILLLAQAATAVPPPCTGPEFAAFDFWVGDWDVYPAQSPQTLVAHSKIERLYAGCAIRESWMPLKGLGGGSLSGFDPTVGRWHQIWIGAQPGRVEFDGGLVGKDMVLAGYWRGSAAQGQDGLTRMTYTPLPGGAVRQHGQVSTDHGVTWAESFDLIYRRRATAD